MGQCAQCSSEQPANQLAYSASGDLVCAECARLPANQAALRGNSKATYLRGLLIVGLAAIAAVCWFALHVR